MKNTKQIILILTILLGCSMPSFAQSGFSARISSNVLLRALAFLIVHDNNDDTTTPTARTDNPSEELGYWAAWVVPLRFNFGVTYQYNLVDDLYAFASADMFYRNLKGRDTKSLSELGTDEVLPTSSRQAASKVLSKSVAKSSSDKSFFMLGSPFLRSLALHTHRWRKHGKGNG